jgi:type VI secretion system protein ImpM
VTGFSAFGKMPALGDFFRINAPCPFVDPWDAWLQKSMHDVRGILGADWQACFMAAPIWRFALSDGLAGPNAMLGVLMPSVDRVGREFPLTLMAPVSGHSSVIEAHFAAQDVFCALEDVALSVLDDDMTRDRLAEKLAQIQVPTSTAAGDIAQSALSHLHHQNPGQTAITSLATGDINDLRRPSIWTAVLDHGPMMMICEALPNVAQARGLFDLAAPIWDPVPQIPEVIA